MLADRDPGRARCPHRAAAGYGEPAPPRKALADLTVNERESRIRL
jgi:hypothetical protein